MDPLLPKTSTTPQSYLNSPLRPPHPTPLSTINTRQPGLKKFTATVHSCHSCWRHSPSFRGCYAAPRPTRREKGWKPQ